MNNSGVCVKEPRGKNVLFLTTIDMGKIRAKFGGSSAVITA